MKWLVFTSHNCVPFISLFESITTTKKAGIQYTNSVVFKAFSKTSYMADPIYTYGYCCIYYFIYENLNKLVIRSTWILISFKYYCLHWSASEPISIFSYIMDKHKTYHFSIFVLCSSPVKTYIIVELVTNFLMRLVRGWHFLHRKENTIRKQYKVKYDIQIT